jgi:hypothetical protein
VKTVDALVWDFEWLLTGEEVRPRLVEAREELADGYALLM